MILQNEIEMDASIPMEKTPYDVRFCRSRRKQQAARVAEIRCSPRRSPDKQSTPNPITADQTKLDGASNNNPQTMRAMPGIQGQHKGLPVPSAKLG